MRGCIGRGAASLLAECCRRCAGILSFYPLPPSSRHLKDIIMARATLQDVKVHVRFKLSALWAALMFCYVYGDYFGLYVPGKLRGMLDGEGPFGPVSEGALAGAAAMLAVPGLMVWLSLALPARFCRWLNVVLGAAYLAIVAMTLPGAWRFYVMLGVVEMGLSVLIAVWAWRWPRTAS
jgi:hypothetical protein